MLVNNRQIFLEVQQEFILNGETFYPGLGLVIEASKKYPEQAKVKPLGGTYALFKAQAEVDTVAEVFEFWNICQQDMSKAVLVSYTVLGTYTSLELPTEEQILSWLYDSSQDETIAGTLVDPDGCDEYGWPSWSLALGLA